MAKKETTDKNKNVNLVKFEMTDEKGKKFVVHAPEDSLDKDAESALEGEYRTC